jgi:hypothetical protein
MNKLLINGKPVITKYVPWERPPGSILQIFIEDTEIHELVFNSLYERLKEDRGLMDDSEIKIRDQEFPEKKFSEIRLLSKSMLWVADYLRSEGISVVEEDPYT